MPFNAIFLFFVHFFHVLRISLADLSSFRAVVNFIYVDSVIIISHTIYYYTGSNRPETLFNTKINNLLVSRSSVLSGRKLLNNKKLKSIYSYSNDVWNQFKTDSSRLNSLLKILLGFNEINPAPFHPVFRFSVKKFFAQALVYISI